MTRHIAIFFTLYSLNTFGQLPTFKSNVKSKESKQSIVKRNFSSKFEYIISYYAHSYWSQDQTYIIFGHDGREWRVLEWTIEMDKQKQIKKQRTRKLKYSQGQFGEFMALMSRCTICNLEQGPLNLNKKDNGDGTETSIFVSDGLFEQIELISPKSHRISNSYAANSLQDEYPTSDRQSFIDFRNQLLKVVSSKS